jgi:Trp operon repressor
MPTPIVERLMGQELTHREMARRLGTSEDAMRIRVEGLSGRKA